MSASSCTMAPRAILIKYDFDFIAAHIAGTRRVLVTDLRGRGRSAYDADERNYSVPVETGDVLQNALVRLLRAIEEVKPQTPRDFLTLATLQIRRELLDLHGPYGPGDRLKLLALAERFDASLSVIREALTRLAEQGLVVATPQHGFSVREAWCKSISPLIHCNCVSSVYQISSCG